MEKKTLLAVLLCAFLTLPGCPLFFSSLGIWEGVVVTVIQGAEDEILVTFNEDGSADVFWDATDLTNTYQYVQLGNRVLVWGSYTLTDVFGNVQRSELVMNLRFTEENELSGDMARSVYLNDELQERVESTVSLERVD